jgi:hypothetical protein
VWTSLFVRHIDYLFSNNCADAPTSGSPLLPVLT